MTVTQQPSRRCVGTLAIDEGRLAVDQDPAITLSLLKAPLLAGREVVGNFRWRATQVIEVVHKDIRRTALAKGAAVVAPPPVWGGNGRRR